MNKLFRKSKSWYLLGLLLADTVFFTLTNPTEVASVVLIAGIILLVATFFMGLSLFLELLSSTATGSPRQHKTVIWVATVLVAFVVAMQSIGQLSTRDLLAVIPLAVLFVLYTSYLTDRK